MRKPDNILKIFEKYTLVIDGEIRDLLSRQEKYEMYDMLSYFFGYLGEDLKPTEGYGGKRFRPGITLLISDFYGTMDKAVEAATSVEIFHNFTLIHDDIEDEDPMRRGRPTVWKKWDTKHAINSGDAQLILALEELHKGEKNYKLAIEPIIPFLNKIFLRVSEGQFLDFKLADSKVNDSFVTIDNYLEMIGRKSAVLVGASAKLAGLVAGKDASECDCLWDYGYNLGMAYQLHDDLVSIWGKSEDTGKVEINDLAEHKKTYPVIYLYQNLGEKEKQEFAAAYDKEGELSHDEVITVRDMLSEAKAHDYIWERIAEYIAKSNKAIAGLSITDQEKEVLCNINSNLIPDAKWWDA